VVVDEDKLPLPGVTVFQTGGVASMTDPDGKFTVEVNPDS